MNRQSISISLGRVLHHKQSKPLVQTRHVMRTLFIAVTFSAVIAVIVVILVN